MGDQLKQHKHSITGTAFVMMEKMSRGCISQPNKIGWMIYLSRARSAWPKPTRTHIQHPLSSMTHILHPLSSMTHQTTRASKSPPIPIFGTTIKSSHAKIS